MNLEQYIRNKLNELEQNLVFEIGTDSVRAWIDLYNSAELVVPINLAKDLFTIIEQEFKITKQQIESKSRKRELVLYRQLFCYFMMKSKAFSLKSVGELIGNRDHTTVIHSVNTIQDLIDINDWQVVTSYNKIKQLLN